MNKYCINVKEHKEAFQHNLSYKERPASASDGEDVVVESEGGNAQRTIAIPSS